MNKQFVPKAGAVRARVDDSVAQANTEDVIYSTLVMFANEYFDGEKWIPVEEKDND